MVETREARRIAREILQDENKVRASQRQADTFKAERRQIEEEMKLERQRRLQLEEENQHMQQQQQQAQSSASQQAHSSQFSRT